jgi:phage-related protein
MATKNLLVRGGADFSAMKKAMDKAQQQIKSFKDNISNSLKGLGALLAGIGAGLTLGAGIKDAMQFEAHMGTLNQTLGEATKGFEEWMNTVGSTLGMSKLQLAQYGNQYSLTLKGIAKDQDDLAKKTQQTLQAVAVIRSKTGMEVTEISDRMRSAMNGEADGADELGVNVRVAAIEASKAYKMMSNGQPFSELSQEMQKAIRWQHTMDSVTQNLGNTMANNTALKMGVFQSSLLNLRMAMGQAWLPILNVALPALTKLSNALTSVFSKFAQFMSALFGYEADTGGSLGAQTEAANSLGDSVAGVGDAYKKAGKEAKKAQGSLAGFDEVNTLAKASEGSSEDAGTGEAGAGGVGVGTPGIPTGSEGSVGAISGKISEMAEKVKGFLSNVKGFFLGVGDFISEHKDIIIAALGGIGAGIATYILATKGAGTATKIWDGIAKASAAVMRGLRLAWAALTGPIGLIVLAVAAAVAAFIYFYRTNDKFKGFVDGVLNKIKDAAIYLWKNALVPMGEYLAKGFKAAWEGIKVAATWLWKNVLVPFGEYLKTFYKVALVPLGNVLKDMLIAYFKILIEVGKSFWKNVMVPLGDFLKASFKPTVEALSAVLKYLWEVVIKPFGVYLGKVFIDIFKLLSITISALYNNVLKPLAPFVMKVLNSAFERVGETITNLKTVFIGLMKFITGVFTGDWRKAWEGVKGVFKGVFDQLYDIVKRPLNLIIDAINAVIGGFNKISVKVPDWVPDFGGKTFGINIPKIPKLARGGIVDGATNFGNYIAGEAGSEMIVPLENTGFVEKLASALGTAVMNAMSNSNTSGDIILKLNEIELGRASAKSINKAQRTAGRLLLDI